MSTIELNFRQFNVKEARIAFKFKKLITILRFEELSLCNFSLQYLPDHSGFFKSKCTTLILIRQMFPIHSLNCLILISY